MPGMPSATGQPLFWLRASSSASVRGGGGGPPPVFRASAFFLLAEQNSMFLCFLMCVGVGYSVTF